MTTHFIKIKKMKKGILIISLALLVASCDSWLLEPSPGVTSLDDYYSSGQTAIQNTMAAYVPLMWEYNSTYFSEWFIGDIVSDDALKGGQSIGDMADAYDLENFKGHSNNGLLLDFYRAQWQGIARCNLPLYAIPQMSVDTIMTADVQSRLIGELKFLRAMYYFRLVRVFGGVPKVDFIIDNSSDWQQQRASADEIYAFIIQDLEDANQRLWLKSKYRDEDLGRATKGAAQAMLLKVSLYTHNYEEAKRWGDSITLSQEYGLVPDYADNFTLNGENGVESVFEIQYMEDETSDYGEGFGFTRGTFSVVLTRSRSSKYKGWGFNKPTQNLYDEYETGDPRRDATIFNPPDSEIETPEQEIYLGCRYLSRKYALMNPDGSIYPLSHDTRGPINTKVIRYADVLLMYAEACCETDDFEKAKSALEQVRARARSGNAVLPAFPYGAYSDGNKDHLRQAIRHERRVELAMEGHRWFDICRWGVAKKVMDAYKATETTEAQSHMATFIEGKHELFPLPSKEIDLNPMN
jgi:hypothetical protein